MGSARESARVLELFARYRLFRDQHYVKKSDREHDPFQTSWHCCCGRLELRSAYPRLCCGRACCHSASGAANEYPWELTTAVPTARLQPLHGERASGRRREASLSFIAIASGLAQAHSQRPLKE